MKNIFIIGCLIGACLQSVLAQPSFVGEWLMNEGTGDVLNDTSGNNWDMTINDGAPLWGYWQTNACTFANGLWAGTTPTTATCWTNGSYLVLKADFNLLGAIHDPGTIVANSGNTSSGVFGALYYTPTGNGAGYNNGAFYLTVDASPDAVVGTNVTLNMADVGTWQEPLPATVTDASVNGGWNTIELDFTSRTNPTLSIGVVFKLNGSVIGTTNIAGRIMQDFSTLPNYQSTEFVIGSCANAGYQWFRGSISNVTLSAGADPAISTVPQNQSVSAGANATFQVVAAGTSPFIYQWYYDATNLIAGATSASLTLTNVIASQSGSYSVIVSNSEGTVAASANLLVYSPAALQLHFYNGLIVQGSVGYNYLIQYTDSATGPGIWQTLTNLALPSSPYYWFDPQSAAAPGRTYQAVAAP